MPTTHVRWALLATGLLLAGCVDDGVRPCDLWTASAVVSGRVTDSSGAGVADAAIEVQIAPLGECDGAGNWAHSKQVTTNAGGYYSADLALGNFSGVRCVRVIELASGTSVRGAVEFVGGCDETRPPGQLNADLVIP